MIDILFWELGVGELGIGNWGLGIGKNLTQSPVPSPQSPVPALSKCDKS
ncbi:hypothetical protein H6F61_02295 [Cyanobacteria bacterium FACHB-472]|nr:hypothetical protein [Cyanobacteria bacterium FACHB-472]